MSAGGASDLQWVRERFAGGDAYRVIAPHICHAVTATLNRMYGVVGTASSKFPGAQPCSVMRDDLKALATDHYVVAPKTDGTRYLMLVSGSAESRDIVFMIDRSMSIWIVPIFFREPVHVSRALFDGELVYDNERGEWLYQIFDLIGCGTRFTPRDNYVKRMENARHLIQHELLPPAVHAPPPPMRVLVKRFYPTYRIDVLLSDMERERGCRNDGLIFTPVPLGVRPFRNRRMFKWKEQSNHTVDFAVLYNVHVSKRASQNRQHLIVAAAERADQSVCESKRDNETQSETHSETHSETQSETQSDACVLQSSAVQYSQRVCVRLPHDASEALRELLSECVCLPRSRQQSVSLSDAEEDEGSASHSRARATNETDYLNSRLTISPDAIDYDAFEFHVIDGDKKMARFGKVDANLNREFLQNNAMAIANSARPMVVECAFENGVWRILLHRADRQLPNAEYTVEKTLQNIRENISLREMADVVRNNTPPAHAKSSNKRARSDSQPPHSALTSRARHASPASASNTVPLASGSMQAQTPSATQPRAPIAALHPMNNIHPSRLARFGATAMPRTAQTATSFPPTLRERSAKAAFAPSTVQDQEYDPCNPAMDACARNERDCSSAAGAEQQRADMSALLRKLQQTIEQEPHSVLSDALLRQQALKK